MGSKNYEDRGYNFDFGFQFSNPLVLIMWFHVLGVVGFVVGKQKLSESHVPHVGASGEIELLYLSVPLLHPT